jgi:hypothetical protein
MYEYRVHFSHRVVDCAIALAEILSLSKLREFLCSVYGLFVCYVFVYFFARAYVIIWLLGCLLCMQVTKEFVAVP